MEKKINLEIFLDLHVFDLLECREVVFGMPSVYVCMCTLLVPE
jgi:hypothetical protein